MRCTFLPSFLIFVVLQEANFVLMLLHIINIIKVDTGCAIIRQQHVCGSGNEDVEKV